MRILKFDILIQPILFNIYFEKRERDGEGQKQRENPKQAVISAEPHAGSISQSMSQDQESAATQVPQIQPTLKKKNLKIPILSGV